MRNLSSASNAASNAAAANRRGSSMMGPGAAATPLASPNQARYKGVATNPGVVKFSQWKKEGDIPQIYFHDFLLSKIKEKDPNKVWLKDASMGRVETFGRVASSVSRIASGLTKIGFGRRDVICMFCSNYVEYWLLALAAWSCGGCVMPVNCETESGALEEQLNEAKAKILVCDDFNFEEAVDILQNTDIVQHVIVVGTEGKGKGCIPVSDLLDDDGKCPPKRVDIDMENTPAYLPFTSAIKGDPKGIMHTHRTLMAMFWSPEGAANHYLDQMVGDSLACGNWFFHVSGFYAVALSAIYGVTVHCLSEYSDTAFLDMIVESRTHTASMYPWQIRLLSQSPSISRYDLGGLKSIVTCGGVLSATIRTELLDRFPGVKFVREAYGISECGLVTLTYPREKKTSVTAAKVMEVPDDHVMPVGFPNMYSQIKIAHRQTGEPVGGPDEQGEICIKSAQMFIGYLNRRENNTLFDSEGFFRTGDLGYYNDQGVIHFIEKLENLIRFWMYEVSPTIIESRLLGSNNIVDAAVVGIPNKENGEVPRAFVVLRPGIEETEENLQGLMESRLKDEERIRGGLYFIQKIPRDENWKIMKNVLKAYNPEHPDGGAPEPAAAAGAKSPNVTQKSIKALEKLPNGAFMAAESSAAETCASPRTKRANRRAAQDPTARSSNAPGRRASLSAPHDTPLVGSAGPAGANKNLPGAFTYWMKVSVYPPGIAAVLMSHPAVDDCLVTSLPVVGVGHLPRAYVAVKDGYQVTADDILSFAHSRLADADRLRGGLAVVDRLTKDNTGKLLVSLDKFDKEFVGIDHEFIRSQPKLPNI